MSHGQAELQRQWEETKEDLRTLERILPKHVLDLELRRRWVRQHIPRLQELRAILLGAGPRELAQEHAGELEEIFRVGIRPKGLTGQVNKPIFTTLPDRLVKTKRINLRDEAPPDAQRLARLCNDLREVLDSIINGELDGAADRLHKQIDGLSQWAGMPVETQDPHTRTHISYPELIRRLEHKNTKLISTAAKNAGLKPGKGRPKRGDRGFDWPAASLSPVAKERVKLNCRTAEVLGWDGILKEFGLPSLESKTKATSRILPSISK